MQSLSQSFDFKSFLMEEKVTVVFVGDCTSSLDFTISTGWRKSNSVKYTFNIKIIHYLFFKHFKCLKGLIALKKLVWLKLGNLASYYNLQKLIILKKDNKAWSFITKTGPDKVQKNTKQENPNQITNFIPHVSSHNYLILQSKTYMI